MDTRKFALEPWKYHGGQFDSAFVFSYFPPKPPGIFQKKYSYFYFEDFIASIKIYTNTNWQKVRKDNIILSLKTNQG